MIQVLKRYFIDHWNGKQSLAWSVWVNLIAVRICVFLLQEWLTPPNGQDFHDARLWVLLLAFVAHGVLFIWQVVGTVRAYELHMKGGSMASVWGAQLSLILMSFWVIIYAIDAWQMTVITPAPQFSQADLQAEREANYSITPSVDRRTLFLTGSLELGITKQFLALIAANPDATTVVLESSGGNIYEARGLAQVIRKMSLTTRVTAQCSSACTTVFLAGTGRELGRDGKLGFHQYRIDAHYSVLTADPKAEQEKDRSLFRAYGVSEPFLLKIFETAATDVWFPQTAELVAANVVTKLTEE